MSVFVNGNESLHSKPRSREMGGWASSSLSSSAATALGRSSSTEQGPVPPYWEGTKGTLVKQCPDFSVSTFFLPGSLSTSTSVYCVLLCTVYYCLLCAVYCVLCTIYSVLCCIYSVLHLLLSVHSDLHGVSLSSLPSQLQLKP